MTQRFFLPHKDGYTLGQQVVLPQEMAHQLSNVLRLQPGDSVVVLDDAGGEYDVGLLSLDRRAAAGEITAVRRATGEPGAALTLFMSLLKRDNFEWVLQKGTELGVARFVPVLTTRTVVRAARPNKLARWQRIIQEAAEQCRRGRRPTLAEPVTWDTAVAEAQQADAALIPWEEAAGQTIAGCLTAPMPVGRVALFIGPEGGYTADEVAQAQAAGVQPVTLGPRILRAETAAVTAVALVMAALGELE